MNQPTKPDSLIDAPLPAWIDAMKGSDPTLPTAWNLPTSASQSLNPTAAVQKDRTNWKETK